VEQGEGGGEIHVKPIPTWVKAAQDGATGRNSKEV
jgi:hypothetical protein